MLFIAGSKAKEVSIQAKIHGGCLCEYPGKCQRLKRAQRSSQDLDMFKNVGELMDQWNPLDGTRVFSVVHTAAIVISYGAASSQLARLQI